MIISDKYKFIFIKTRKTAGTSIEVELSQVVEESAIVTEIYPKNKSHRPRNFELESGKIYRNHTTAKNILLNIGPIKFHEYFKFCVEREPVDKCISHFSMNQNSPHHNQNKRFASWNDYIAKRIFPIDTDKFLSSNGQLIVDRILKYETLESEISEVCSLLGLPQLSLTTREKSGFREHPEILTSHKNLIYEEFALSNRFTGY